MGDIANMNDIERFLRSPQGRTKLESIETMLLDHRIVSVAFSNEVDHIAIHLLLNDGGKVTVTMDELEIEALRDTYEGAIRAQSLDDNPTTPNNKEKNHE